MTIGTPVSFHARRLRGYVVPVALVAVAVLQLVRAHTVEQSSWSGAGFGMFATYENEDSRFLRVWLVSPDGEELGAVPGDLEREALEARVVPGDGSLAALAERISAGVDDASVTEVRVELWGVTFDHPDARLGAVELAEGSHRR